MLKDSYGHEHTGILRLNWDDVMGICRELARTIQAEFDPDIVVGIAKSGLIPGVILSSMLRKDLYPVRLSRRKRDVVVRARPEWTVPMSEDVDGKSVLIVDEFAATGETMRLAVGEARKKGARQVKTATLCVHTGSWRPNWYGLETNDLIIQPWDYEVLDKTGRFIIHPEYEEAIDRMDPR
jgi:hypoxanthine phosphoribosyltransferase